LLVDDAETILMMERMILGKSYTLITAKDGEKALTVAGTEKPELIILDIVMAKLDGFKVCRSIKSDENTKTFPVIMETTQGDSSNVEKGIESGCNDYVTKPINGAELLSKVRSHLGE